MKRTSTLINSARTKVSPIGQQAKRAYSSEMANALVQVSQNLGMGSAAIGLGGAGKNNMISRLEAKGTKHAQGTDKVQASASG